MLDKLPCPVWASSLRASLPPRLPHRPPSLPSLPAFPQAWPQHASATRTATPTPLLSCPRTSRQHYTSPAGPPPHPRTACWPQQRCSGRHRSACRRWGKQGAEASEPGLPLLQRARGILTRARRCSSLARTWPRPWGPCPAGWVPTRPSASSKSRWTAAGRGRG